MRRIPWGLIGVVMSIFKAIIGWHAFAYVCSLLGCFGVVPQINMNAKDFHDVGIEWCPKHI